MGVASMISESFLGSLSESILGLGLFMTFYASLRKHNKNLTSEGKAGLVEMVRVEWNRNGIREGGDPTS